MKSNSVGTSLTVNNKVIGALTSINGIEITADTIDVSSLDNSSGYREKLPGFKDAGEVTCSGFLDGSDQGQSELYTLLASGDVVACVITFPAKIGKKWSFNAGVVGFKTSSDVGGAITFDCTLVVSGQPTLAATGGVVAYPDELGVTTANVAVSNITGAVLPITVAVADGTKAAAYVNGTEVIVRGIAAGSTTVTVTDAGSHTDTITVTVTAAG